MFPWLHPSVVHFAVALLFTGVLLDVLGLWKTNEKLLFAGYWNTLLGAAATVAAVVSGLLAEESLGAHSRTGSAILEFHRIFGFAGCVTALTMATVRVLMRGYILPKFRTIYLTIALLGAGFLLTTGSLGGTLVYAYGLGLDEGAIRRAHDALTTPQAPPTVPKTGLPAVEPVDAGTPAVNEQTEQAEPPDAGPAEPPAKVAKRKTKRTVAAGTP